MVDHIAEITLPSVAVALAPGKNKFLRLLERSNSSNFYRANLEKKAAAVSGTSSK